MESSCEFGIEPSGSMKCWETLSGLSSSAQLRIVSYRKALIKNINFGSMSWIDLIYGSMQVSTFML
jgi:hypothetical protein